MSPVVHLLASWFVAAGACDNPRDRRLLMLAGIAPDLDGLGILVDMVGGGGNSIYQTYHHQLLHGIFGAVLIACSAAMLARRPARVLVLAMVIVHLHLFCDLVGSRGPEPADVWPIPYLAPFSDQWTFAWSGQWQLVGPENIAIGVGVVLTAILLTVRLGHSPACVLGARADAVFVRTSREWRGRFAGAGRAIGREIR